MADSSLQERLRDHAAAFDGLLSLIPAKMYYGEDNTNQWQRKKQTKAEAAAARRSKLDPDSQLHRTAKEVMEERANNKRKLKELTEEDDDDDNDTADGNNGDNDSAEADEDDDDEEDQQITQRGIQRETPGQGLKKGKTGEERNKKQKLSPAEDEENQEESIGEPIKLSKKEEKRMAKLEKKKEKKQEKKSKSGGEQEASQSATSTSTTTTTTTRKNNDDVVEDPKSSSSAKKTKSNNKVQETKEDDKAKKETLAITKEEPAPKQNDDEDNDNDQEEEEDESEEAGSDDEVAENDTSELQHIDLSGLTNDDDDDDDDEEENDEDHSSNADSENNASTAKTSISSSSTTTKATAASTEDDDSKPKHIKIPADTSALRARLTARIDALRAARKAIGPDGKPIRTRQELIESRRVKQAQRKAHKKELRAKSKVEADLKREEALASASPSVMSPALELGEDEARNATFSFGRVAFSDGTQLSHDLSYSLNGTGEGNKKKKGPSDPKTALLKVQNQKKRLNALDAEKRNEIQDKEAWLTARRRAEGEKIRDDEAILKKAVKRKEQAKKKSEREWKDRAKGVEDAVHQRQKRREENLQKRRDDKASGKGGKNKKKGGASSSGGAKKKGGRPGFEGSSLGFGKKKK